MMTYGQNTIADQICDFFLVCASTVHLRTSPPIDCRLELPDLIQPFTETRIHIAIRVKDK